MDDKIMEWIKELYQKNLELELKVKELEWKIEQLNREDKSHPYDKGDIGISFGHSEPIFSGASQPSTGCSTRDSWGVSGSSTCFSPGISRSVGISRSEGVVSDTKGSGTGRIVGIS